MGAARTDAVGRYELLIELAKGGMAELYVGRLHGVGGFAKLVAIKRILPHLAEDKLFAEMFLNEGRIAAQLAHANICQVHELGEADGDLFLAMEYLEGVPWSELINKLPRAQNALVPTTLRLTAGVIAQACEGLHFAHELRDLDGNATPVVHRDVSPQNLFVTTDGTCKVLDFGIAKMLKDGPRTRTGVLKGKLPYMSPEQIQGEDVDARSDVFALGVVLWESLTGKALFDRETDFLIWKAITEAPIPPLAPFGIPASIDAVIGSALARDKKLRFRSARALGEALRNAVEPIGGVFDANEIADVVRLHCGGRLVERQREIASAVTRRSKPDLEPTAADTIEDKAGSTTDLSPMRTNADSTVRLRSDAKAVERPPVGRSAALAPDATLPPARPRDRATSDASASRTRGAKRRSKAPWIIAGSVIVAAVIVAIAVTRSPEPPPAIATAPATVTDEAGSIPGLDYARTTLEGLGLKDERIGKAMESLESVSKLTQRMESMRASMHGTDEVDEPSTDDANEPSTETDSRDEPTPAPAKPDPKRTAKTTPAATVTGEGLLSVDSSPFATIYLDGNKLGATPFFNQPVSAGTHQLRAVLDDGRSQKRAITIETGKTLNLGKLSWPEL
ncbi:MAG: protein kinase domain-containing protein [Kofleriaceae bacterium]